MLTCLDEASTQTVSGSWDNHHLLDTPFPAWSDANIIGRLPLVNVLQSETNFSTPESSLSAKEAD